MPQQDKDLERAISAYQKLVEEKRRKMERSSAVQEAARKEGEEIRRQRELSGQ